MALPYRTPEEGTQHAKLVFAGAPRGRWLRHGLTVAVVGLGLFCALFWYGARLSCERPGTDAVGRCSLFDPVLAAYVEFAARPGAVTASEVASDDTTHIELHVPGHASGVVSERAAREAAQAYDAFVADASAHTLARRVPGTPWALVIVTLPLLLLVVSMRRAERSRRVLLDIEGDELLVEEVDVRGVQRKASRFHLSTIEKTSVEGVEDSDAYELVAHERSLKRPLYRASDDECRRLKPIVDQAIERVTAQRGGRSLD